MIRPLMIMALLALSPSLAHARDDGGFGESFTNTSPSALVPGAPPTLAQLAPYQDPNAQDLQNIMPAAGDELAPEPELIDKAEPETAAPIVPQQ